MRPKRACSGTWDSRIYFLPGGDRPSRRNTMFIDILLWQLDNPPPASLVVVSNGVRGDKEFFGRLRSISVDSYVVDVIARPTHPVVPESVEWPRSLLARSYSLIKALNLVVPESIKGLKVLKPKTCGV
ncbi:hypothetical protein Bca4012_054993 [Brassica carinata]